MERWAEHFKSVQTRLSISNAEAIAQTPQFDTNDSFDVPENKQKPLSQLSSGKAPGSDAIPAEVYKAGDPAVADKANRACPVLLEPHNYSSGTQGRIDCPSV